MKRVRRFPLALIAILGALIATGVLMAGIGGTLQGGFQNEEDAAVERATQIAHGLGLQQPVPDSLKVNRTTLAEWFRIVGFVPGPDAASVGLDSGKPIWIVAMKGPVQWSGAGRQPGGIGDAFDNISVAISADNLEHIGSHAAGPGEPLPLGLER